MREILFRGKRLDNGEWVEGRYQPETTIKHWNGIQETVGVTIAYKAEDGFLEDTLVDPSTVGQYTGLTDKNGKRIFEGDILSLRTGRRHVVMFEDGAFALENTAIPMRFANKFEVIGNIHDNQDMLKGGDV